MDATLAFLEEHRERFLDELGELLGIASISTSPEHAPAIGEAADWLAAHIEGLGLASEVVATEGHPVVIGEWRGAEGAPTVLVYGHYDVQPADPLDKWTSPPFEATVRQGRLYARGATDDKGQLFLHLKAIEAWLETTGRLPVNVVLLLEGEEEIGSGALMPFVHRYAKRLAADVVVISDSPMLAPGVPTIYTSLRGGVGFDVDVDGPSSDLHSGIYGGAVVNPATALSRMLATLHDENWRVAVAGFYDQVDDASELRAYAAEAPYDEAAFLAETGAPALGGEAGFLGAGADLGETDVRSPRHLLRLYRGRRQDDHSGFGTGQAGLPVGREPGSGPDRTAGRGSPARRSPGTDPAPSRELQCLSSLAGRHGEPGVQGGPSGFARRPSAEPRCWRVAAGASASCRSSDDVLGAPILLMGFGSPGENRSRTERMAQPRSLRERASGLCAAIG